MSHSSSSAEFREALAHFPSGVTVVTAQCDARLVGVTASAFTAVSLEPPLVLVCLAKAASAQQVIAAAHWFAVSVLAEAQGWVAKAFARAGVDRFRDVPVRVEGESSLPLVEGALVHLECRRFATHAAGDHDIVVGEVQRTRVAPGRPLVHYRRQFGGFAAAEGAPHEPRSTSGTSTENTHEHR